MSDVALLVVEDDPDDEELIRASLSRADPSLPVVIAHDGEEALRYLRSGEQALPRAVLLDLCLPDLSGHELLRRLRADPRTRSLPVIIFSSSKLPADIDASYRLGANAYVQKPNGFKAFAKAIGALTSFWGELNLVASEAGK